MNWFLAALLSAVLLSAYQVSTRVFLKDKGDSNAFTFVTALVGGLFALPLLALESLRFQPSALTLLLCLFVAALFAATDLVFTKARQLEQVSVVGIAIQTGFFWSLLGGLLIFGEPLGWAKAIGVGFILLSNLTTIWKGQRFHLSPGFLLALLGTFLFNLSSGFNKVLIKDFSPTLYIGSLSLLEAFIIYLSLGRNRLGRIRNELRTQGWSIIMVGPLLLGAIVLLNKAFESGGEFSKVLPVFSLALVFSTVTGIIFLGEKENTPRKILAMALAFLGAYLIQSS